jgi:branched-chain amino acid transport system permease protein
MIAGVAIAVTYQVTHSRVGLAFRALATNEDAAQSLGVNVARFKLIAFVISAVFASIGGSMLAHYVTYISPEVFGLYMVVLIFTMLFVGGISTTLGPLIGAVIITIFPEVLRQFHSARELLYGLVLLLILLFAPRGVFGLGSAAVRWVRGRHVESTRGSS